MYSAIVRKICGLVALFIICNMFFAHQSKVCWSCVILISIFDVLLAERQSSAQLRHPQIQLAVVIPFIENEFPSVIRVLHVWRNFGNLCSKGTSKEIDLVFYSNKARNFNTVLICFMPGYI